MKTCLVMVFCTSTLVGERLLSANAAEASAPMVVERGPHHRIVRKMQSVQVGDRPLQRQSDIVELESGMHRWDGQEWVETSPKLNIVNGKAVANLFYSVEFAPNLATRGAVSVTLPDGNRLTMQVLGLAYVDGPKSVMVAEIQDCAAEIGGPEENEITYRDAFTDFPIDCKFIVRKGSLSQHIRIRGALPPPTDYGLSENAFLEIFTEAVELPEGTAQTQRWRVGDGERSEILDERISFGSMEFVVGKAFFANESALEGEVPVSKIWSVLENRTFLRERLPFREIKEQLARLPMTAKAGRTAKGVKHLAGGFLPPRRGARPAVKAIEVASSAREPSAYVIDYELVASANMLLWKGDSTFYIAGAVSVKTNVFEGGCVIKLAPTNSAKLTITGPVTNYASQFRPVTFTARDDHTIGEVIGTNVVSGYYGAKALELDWYTAGAVFNLEHFRFRYAQVGVHFNGGLGNVLSHAQFVNCSNAIEQTSSDVSLRNALIHRANNAFVGNSGSTNRGEHLTIHEVVNYHSSGSPVLFVTNSLLVAITNAGTYSGLSNQTAAAVGSGFQTVGAGQHYLTNNSVWRDAGTVNINADLMTYLARSTTYPPTIGSNEVVSSDAVLTPQVSRDVDAPDLGYHYGPLDYALYAYWVSNCVLTITNGVSIGGYGGAAFILERNSELVTKGRATDLVHFGPYDAVQEQPLQWGQEEGGGHGMIMSWWTNGVAPKVNLRFAVFDGVPGWPIFHLYSDDGPRRGFTNITVRDCQFSGGELYLWEISGGSYTFTNTVFERVGMQIIDPVTLAVANANVRGGWGFFWQMNGSNGLWQFKNSLVDTSTVIWASDCLREYNAFYQSPDFYSIQNTSATEKVLTSLVYETGRFGRWYQPTNSTLINAGSTTDAATVGFYWYTTTTNHVIEGNSRLDIGYHSVGLDSSTGEPWDTNQDGVPNYLQDLSGNGITEPNELPGLKMWLKADAGVTNDAYGVNGWADQSGNNNHGRQTTDAKKPLQVTGAINGKPVVRFDGTNDFISFPSSFATSFGQAEIVAVIRADSNLPSEDTQLWRFGPNVGSYYPHVSTAFNTNWIGAIVEDFGSQVSRSIGKPSITLTQYHTYGIVSRTNEWTVRINGIIQHETVNSNAVFGSTTSLGVDAASTFRGDVAEVFFYNTPLLQADREALGYYLNQRYALVAAPAVPSGLRATAVSSNQVSVSWTNGILGSALRFSVERKTSGGSFSTVGLVRNGSSFFDSGLLAGTMYSYRVKAVNDGGDSAYSAEVSTATSNITAQIPLADLRTWLMSDVGVAGTNVSFWEDQSGYRNHASQGSTAKQPKMVPFGLHAKPLARFDGTSDYLEFRDFINISNSLQEAEAVIVLRVAEEIPGILRTLWQFGKIGGRYPNVDGRVREDFGRNDSVPVDTLGSGMTLDSFHIYGVSTKSGEFINRWNKLILRQTNNNTVYFPPLPLLGTASTLGNWFQGEIVEFQIYNRVLSTAERDTIHFYLSDKYGFFDADGDGLLDRDEALHGTNPDDTDSNDDGLTDWEAVQVGISAVSDDVDGDGISNATEIANGTSPFASDTDADGVSDSLDVFPLDPTRSSLPSQPGDTTPPTINLREPTNATPL